MAKEAKGLKGLKRPKRPMGLNSSQVLKRLKGPKKLKSLWIVAAGCIGFFTYIHCFQPLWPL
jgi:hypothetical protein